jgi:hypothetical protein
MVTVAAVRVRLTAAGRVKESAGRRAGVGINNSYPITFWISSSGVPSIIQTSVIRVIRISCRPPPLDTRAPDPNDEEECERDHAGNHDPDRNERVFGHVWSDELSEVPQSPAPGSLGGRVRGPIRNDLIMTLVVVEAGVEGSDIEFRNGEGGLDTGCQDFENELIGHRGTGAQG